MAAELGAKRLGLLYEMAPQASRIALIVNPANPVAAESVIRDVQAGASASGRRIHIFNAGTSREIEAAFAALVKSQAEALIVGADPFFLDRRVQVVTLATRHLLPSIYFVRDFVEVGGLMSYGTNNLERFRMIGSYAGRILKGEKPADMPVAQPTKFELVVNVQTARAIDLAVPQGLLAQADEVIE
jgi:putative ABC transport system substrate-binding protein